MKNTDYHMMHFGHKAELEVFVPGSVNLFGVLSSFYSGTAVVGTDSNGLTVSISKAKTEVVSIVNTYLADKKKFKINQLKLKRDDKFAGFIKAIYVSLGARGKLVPAVDIVLDGPALTDTSSLGCISVALGSLVALDNVFGLNLSKEDYTRIVTEACSFNNVLPLAAHIFNLVYSEENSLSMFDYETRSGVTNIKIPSSDEYGLYLVDTNIAYDTLREEYEYVGSSITKGLGEFRQFYPLDNVKKLSSFNLSNPLSHISTESLKTCKVLHDEYVDVVDFKKQVSKGDLEGVGKAFYRQLNNTHKHFEFFCPEKNWMEKHLMALKGCLGVGYVFSSFSVRICVIFKKSELENIEEVFSDYNRIFSYKASIEEFKGCGSVRIIK